MSPEQQAAQSPDLPGLAFHCPWRLRIDAYRPRARGGDVDMAVLVHSFEPPPLLASRDEVIAAAAGYDLILTYDETIVATTPHAEFFPHGERWVTPAREPLAKGVSFIFSEGASRSIVLPGYDDRAA